MYVPESFSSVRQRTIEIILSCVSKRTYSVFTVGHSECSIMVDRQKPMLETIIVVLIILWGLGLVSSYTMGGFIHLLLVLALIVVAVRLIRGRSI